MRVIAGTARSIPLAAPKGTDTRPTTDRIKETLFNILQNDLPGAVFLDIFAGSGAMGIEALSRGADRAVFVDMGRAAIDCINANISKCRFNDRASVIKADAGAVSVYFGRLGLKKDERLIIFMDPPYDKGAEIPVLRALSGMEGVGENCIIIIEESLRCDMGFVRELGFEIYRTKEYKNQKHIFLRKAMG
ncbi:MAG: 16S rRNA (guanine(966)-N(2))-methyltransferase RsmD [Clostridiales bacterium]|nr:16S rRNA (guanine(966)-N(2))-methyltransferase RsmD [Clostridiales bacterium]